MICAIVPVKILSLAKGRLAPVLSPSERRALVMAMLNDVLTALKQVPTIDTIGVISRDATVLGLAIDRGAEALRDYADSLNGTLTQAARHYTRCGASALLVLPADIPFVTADEIEQLIGSLEEERGLVLAASGDGGTNALFVRPSLELPFQFGPNSLMRHLEVARRLEFPTHVFQSPGLDLDIDQPVDLALAAESEGSTATQLLLHELDIVARMICAPS